MRIAVTGGNGKLGRAVVARLVESGHTVLTLDAVGQVGDSFTRIDLADYGQVADALASVDNRHSGLDAVVHLAAIPAGGLAPDSATFHNNISATFNVFQAARRAGIKRIVYASSETLLGIPFEIDPPYLPVDEDYPSRPESMYAVVKHLEEELASKLVRWDPELSIIALRFSNVLDASDYERVPGYQDDARLRSWNLWGYIDTRDGALAVENALAADLPGFDTFIIAAADTLMERPSAELAAEVFPDVAFRRPVEGGATLLSIDKARRVLGFEPQHSWRD
ncbi:MAG: putative nucleoside-diphosphate-sugar epimerase [Glaciihabitans sp.]|nr:putative nucleoside-diphosphate-sugar epimerase [Glaciihabitans sp.]